MYEGKLVRLRALAREDLPRCVEWINDYEVARFLEFDRPISLEAEQRWYDGTLGRSDDYIFAIETLEGRYIGNIGLHQIHPRDHSAMLGIFVGDKAYWSRGYGSDAVSVLLRYGFEALNLHRIWLHVYEYNRRGIRCYEKCGFKHEGTLRHALYREGRYHDIHVMGILRDEYVRCDE